MKIKKIGHCCLVIEYDGVKLMTDPGSYSTLQTEEINVDYVLITHEHGDHVHIPSLKLVIENNPMVKIITNSLVSKLLEEENIESFILESGKLEEGMHLYAETCDHVDIYDTVPVVQNTGYLIGERLFYPGDAWLVPEREVEILALPCGGPWWKVRDAVEYGLKVKAKYAFNVHDAMLKPTKQSMNYILPQKVLGEAGTEFKILLDGETLEY
jgi:L-ascorbate metabolism protein UlaG (beta-lactamase superfamily)